MDGGGTHSFNKINGHYIDLTIEPFDLYHIPVEYEPNYLSFFVSPIAYLNKKGDEK